MTGATQGPTTADTKGCPRTSKSQGDSCAEKALGHQFLPLFGAAAGPSVPCCAAGAVTRGHKLWYLTLLLQPQAPASPWLPVSQGPS